METRHYLTCLWPGLAELWWRGRLSALPVAIGFALALNLMLVTRYLYPQWVSSGLASMAFWIGGAAWIVFVVHNIRELPALVAPRSVSEEPDRFPEAQLAFLRANWTEAEKLLGGVLAIEARDPPALLLLTSVYRHTDRLQEAELLLKEIELLEVCDRWHLEIVAETKRLARAKVVKAETEQAEREKPTAAADMAREAA